jgi:hypothetical protein
MPRKADLSEFVERLGAPAQASSSEVAGLLKTTYYLRPEQAKALKVRAVQEGRTVSELARDAIDFYLNQ